VCDEPSKTSSELPFSSLLLVHRGIAEIYHWARRWDDALRLDHLGKGDN
jgi:hypothetical protein